MFRLNRMNTLYPDYVTQPIINTWQRHYRNLETFDFRSHADFQSWDPAAIRLGNEGGYEAVSSFGGGTSKGGGGASSSW